MKTHKTWQGQTLELFACADHAMRQIPPAFPLAATVAVNPWLGQTGEDRTIAAARMARVGGGRIFLPRAAVSDMIAAGHVTPEDLFVAAASQGLDPDDLAHAAKQAGHRPAALFTIADIAQRHDGVDWPTLIEERISHWAAAHFDRGQAFWPAPDVGAWASWHAYASRDLTPGLAGLAGFAARVEAMPRDPREAFADACEALDLAADTAPLYFHRLLTTLSGWAQYARHFCWIAERDGATDDTLFELLTVRLAWEVALRDQVGNRGTEAWKKVRADYARPIEAGPDMVIDAALQEAVDRSGERRLAELMSGKSVAAADRRPAIQAAFCIDVRSEPLRRALEATSTEVCTIGFAGFFGLPLDHKGYASDISEARAPILLAPGIASHGSDGGTADTGARVHLRTFRAWGRFKRAAVSAFAFVEAAGPLYVGKLLRDALGLTAASPEEPAPRLGMNLDARIEAAGRILDAMSLTDGFARLVMICGHGATVTNAPHASALQCGACGGFPGDVNARVLSGLLNDTAVREGLATEGIRIPADTHFIAALHDTVSDEIRLFADAVPDTHRADIAHLRSVVAKAGLMTRTERARTLPRGSPGTVARRGRDWSEVRPEWGLAGCHGFIAAPRERTKGRNLGATVFLHDYDWRKDEGAATLELILTAPVVVASWIALQYHGSTVEPDVFGAGNKLLHNVVGGIGVLEGNGGSLRAGLPWQSVHDGDMPRHVPSRLVVMIAAPEEMITRVLVRQPTVRDLFDNCWLTLATLEDAGGLGRRYENGTWVDRHIERSIASQAA